MHVSTLVRRSAALLAVLVAAGACSDATSAPHASQRPAFDVEALQPEATRSSSGESSPQQSVDENVATLTIDPNVSRTYAFGQNWIYFPAHSICDPATSGYGVTLWDAPCTPINQPIQVTVRWSSKGGYAFAQFSPELRFVPADSRNSHRWVVLSLHTNRTLHSASAYNILYDAGAAGFIDESITDPTLRAWLDPIHNAIYRRVKHFSGYMVAAGYSSGFGGMGDASY
ncbi:MAG TPA: hypothetical protein VJN70_14320 [Gemmatimonadaceae bacterium]|nr:hypothetical protein [Gemmatimonadaceae bacterium]